jgi:hypothetical protein
MGESYHTLGAGAVHTPWAPFRAVLTDHDRAVIADLQSGELQRAEKAKLESLQKLADYNKRKRAAKTWGKPPRDGMRWNSITAKWE